MARALPLDREAQPAPRRIGRRPQLFFLRPHRLPGSLGPFYGRWHLDRRNSFYYRESGLKGLIQIARIGQMPLQQAARVQPRDTDHLHATGPGRWRTASSSPGARPNPNTSKPQANCSPSTKAASPSCRPPGLHTHVAEVDFASMYPTIMAIHNISPETVNCSCCLGEEAKGGGAGASDQLPVVSRWLPEDHCPPSPLPQFRRTRGEDLSGRHGLCPKGEVSLLVTSGPRPSPQPVGAGLKPAPTIPALPLPPVPEAGYRLCHRREGLVPRTSGPSWHSREQLKARAKELAPEEARPYKERQTALKWMLVTCFGYLGYKNARFGQDRGPRGRNRLRPGQALVRQGDLRGRGLHSAPRPHRLSLGPETGG